MASVAHDNTNLNEHTTRTTRQGAPGTLSAKITKLYGGSVTCDKARKLKQRRSATAHDKSQANWFINMHDCDNQLSEVLTTPPSTPINWTRTEDSWVTKFPFDDHTVEIEIADLDAHSQGLWVEFSVDGTPHITGKLGARSAQLLTWAIKKMNIQGIYFTASEPSRKKLYAALSREFARKLGWQLTVDASKIPYAPGAREQGYFVHMPSVQEAAGVGLVVPGVNQPAGIHKDEIRRQAAKLGFDVTAQGVPPTARTNGKIP